KLIDNLRRSLVPAALTLLLVLGWTVLAPAGWWTFSVLAILVVPPIFSALFDACRKPDELLFRQHFAAVASSLFRHLRQVGLEFSCLPYEAFFSLDAIARTLWRLLISRRHLLEWNPSSEVERQLAGRSRSELAGCLRAMWIGPFIAVAVALHLLLANPALLAVAGPFLVLWLLSPLIAWWVSRPLAAYKVSLSAEQRIFLRRIARRTWAFFERFVGPEDHWLAPDNYQEYRIAAIAHRTSPTNMGLALLANLAAHDFGFIPGGRLLERTASTLRTMTGLARYRGHFYNWYDTQTLEPLPVLYVSTVDSGNLAGHLLTLRGGLLALADERILTPRLFAGLGDTLGLLADNLDGADAGSAAAFRKDLETAAAAPPATLAAMRQVLLRLLAGSGELLAGTAARLKIRDEMLPENEANEWALALARQLDDALDELEQLTPWFTLQPAPAGLESFARLADDLLMPTLRGVARLEAELCPAIDLQLAAEMTPAQCEWLAELRRLIVAGSSEGYRRIGRLDALAGVCGELA
ncbi:MAG: cyclic beta 1-2 glucan synthetase, partial [Azonexus sp.]